MSDFSEGHDLGKLQGKREERERIIKLLEDEYDRGGYEMGIVPHFIAIIKGENK